MQPILFLYPAGKDRFGRPVFTDFEGNAYVDTDYQKHPRTRICTKYPKNDAYYGEPDCPVARQAIVFADGPFDTLVEELNERREALGLENRYILLPDGRLFFGNGESDGDNFDEIPAGNVRLVLASDNVRLAEEIAKRGVRL